MRFLVGFILVLVGISCVQSGRVVRQATDNVIDLDLLLLIAPELSPVILPIKDTLAQVSGLLPPDQFQAFQQQMLQLILSLAKSNIDVNQFKQGAEVILEQYLGPNGKNYVDVDQLLQQALAVDPSSLPAGLLDLLG